MILQMTDKIELEAELVQLRGIEGEVEGELDVLRYDRNKLEEELKPLRGLKGHLEALKSVKSNLETKNQELQKEIEDRELECEKTMREFGQMKMDIVTLRNERDELRSSNTHLKSQLQEEEKLLRDTCDERDSLYDRAKKAEDEYRRLKRHMTNAGIGNCLPMSQQSASQEAERRRILSESSAENLSLKNKVESLSDELHRSRLDVLATRNPLFRSQSTAGSECDGEDGQIGGNWRWRSWSGTDAQPSPRLNVNIELDALRREKDTLSSTCEGLRSLLREADVQKGRANAERESLMETIEQQASQLQKIEQKDGRLAEMEELLSEKVKRDQNTCTELELRVRELEGLLYTASERSEGLQSRLLEYETRTKEPNSKTPLNTELEKHSVDLQQELAYQQTKYEASLNRVKELERLLEMADRRNAKLEISLRAKATENETKAVEMLKQHERNLQNLLHETIKESSIGSATNSEYEMLLVQEKAGMRGPMLEAELLAAGKSIALLGNLKRKLRSLLQRGRRMLVIAHGLLGNVHDDDVHHDGICSDGAVERVDKNWSFTHMISISDSSMYLNQADPMKREMACYMHGLILDSGQNQNPDGGDGISTCSSSHLFSISASDIDMSSIGKERTNNIHSTTTTVEPSRMNDHHHPIHVWAYEEETADCLSPVPPLPDSAAGTLSVEDELALQWSIMQDTVQRLVKERSELVGRLADVMNEVRRGEISAVQTKDTLDASQAAVSKWKLSSETYAKEALLAVKEVELLKREIDIQSRSLRAADIEKQALSRDVEMEKAKLVQQEANKKLTVNLERERKKLLDQEEFQHTETLKRCEIAEMEALEAKSEADKLHVVIELSDAKLSVLTKEKNSLKEALRKAVAAADLQQQQHDHSATNFCSSSPIFIDTKLSDDDGSIPQLITEMGQNLKRAKEEAEEAQFALKANAIRESEVLDRVQLLASGLDEERRAVEKRLSESEIKCQEMAAGIKALQENIVRKETELAEAMKEAQVLRRTERELKTTLDNASNDIMLLEKRLDDAHANINDAQADAETARVEIECLRAEVSLEVSKRLEHVNSSEKAKDMINQELEDARGCYSRLLEEMKSLKEEETDARARAAEVSYALLAHESECLESVTSDRDNLLKELRVTEAASLRQKAVFAQLGDKLKEALGVIMAACSSSSLHPSGSTFFVPNAEADLSQSFQKVTDTATTDNSDFADDAESAAFASICATLSMKGLEDGEVVVSEECNDRSLNEDVLHAPFGFEQQPDALTRIQMSPMFDESGDTDRSIDERENIYNDSMCSASMLATPVVSSELTSVAQQIIFASKRVERFIGWCEAEVLRQREGFESSSQEVVVLRSQLNEMFRELEVAKDAAKEAGGSRLELQILAEQWEDLNKDREQMMNDAVAESLAMQAQRDEARYDITKLESIVHELEAQRDEAKCDIRKLQSVVHELEAKVESQRVELDDCAAAESLAVQAQRDEARCDIRKLQSVVHELEAMVESQRVELDDCAAAESLAVQAQRDEARCDIRKLQSVVHELKAKVESQRVELDDAHHEPHIARSDAMKASLSTEENDALFYMKEPPEQLAAAEMAEANISSQLFAAENKAKRAREELKTLQMQLPAKIAEICNCQSNALNEHPVMLEVMLCEAQDVLSDASGRVMFYEGQEKVLHAELDSCHKQASNLQAVLKVSKEAEAQATAGRDDDKRHVQQLQHEIYTLKAQWKALSATVMEGNKTNKILHSSSDSVNVNLYQPEEVVAHVHAIFEKVNEYHDRTVSMKEELVDALARSEHAEFRAQTLTSEAEEKAGQEIEVQKLKDLNSVIESELVETNERLELALLALGEMEDAHVTAKAKRDRHEPLERLNTFYIPFVMKENRLLEHTNCNSGQFEQEFVVDEDIPNKENKGSGTTTDDTSDHQLVHSLSTNLGRPSVSSSSEAPSHPTTYISTPLASLLDLKQRVEAVTLLMKKIEFELLDEGICSNGSGTLEPDGSSRSQQQIEEQQSAIELIANLSESEELLCVLMQAVSSLETTAMRQSSHLVDLKAELITLRTKNESEFVKYEEAAKLNSKRQPQVESLKECTETLILQLMALQMKCSDLGMAIGEKDAVIAELEVEKQTMKMALAEKSVMLESERAHAQQVNEALASAESMVTLLEVDKEALEGCIKMEKERSEEFESSFKFVKAELETKVARVEELEEAVSYGADEILTSVMDVTELMKAKHAELEVMSENKKKAENLASEWEAEAQVAKKEVKVVRAELDMVSENKKKAENLASKWETEAQVVQEEVKAIRAELESEHVMNVELSADIEHLLKLLNDDKPSGVDITKENELRELRAAHEIALIDVKKYRTLAAAIQKRHDTALEDAREATIQLKDREAELNDLKSVVDHDKEALHLTRKELEELEGKHKYVSFLLVQNAEAREKEMLDAKMSLDAVSNDARCYRDQARALESKLEDIQLAQSERHFEILEEAEIATIKVRNLEERIQELLRAECDGATKLKDLEDMVIQSNSAFQGAKTKLIRAEERLEKYRCHLQEAEERATVGGSEIEGLKEELRLLRLSYEVKLTEANAGLENQRNCLNDAQKVSNIAEAEIERLKEELRSLQLLYQAVLAESAEREEKDLFFFKNVEEKAMLEVKGMKKDIEMLRSSYEAKLAESNETLEKEQSDLKDAHERSKAAGVEIKGLKENLRMLQFSYEAKLAESNEMLEKEQSDLKDAHERLTATRADLNGLKEEHELLLSSYEKTSVRVSESEKTCLEAVEQRLKSETDLVNVKGHYKECTKMCEKLSKEMEELLYLQELQQRFTELVSTTGVGRSLQGYGYCLNEDEAALSSAESLSPSSIEYIISVFQALCKAHIADREVRPDPVLLLHLVLLFLLPSLVFVCHVSILPIPSFCVSCKLTFFLYALR